MKSRPESKIYFFENEPVNVNLIGKALPEVRLFFLDTTHSRREEVLVPVLVLEDFAEEGVDDRGDRG